MYNNSVARVEDHTLDPVQITSDALSLQDSFNLGLNNNDGEDEAEEDEGAEEDEESDDSGDDDNPNSLTTRSSTSNNQTVIDAKKWVDEYIFKSRRKSGRNTEASVISQWKVSSNLCSSTCVDSELILSTYYRDGLLELLDQA